MKAEPLSADVVAYGTSPAGVTAVVAAAQAGLRCCLIVPGHHVGGMPASGLSYSDLGDRRIIGGPGAGLYAAMRRHYGEAAGRYAGPEPHVAEAYFARLLEEHGITVVYDGWLDRRPGQAVVQGGRIVSLALEDGRTVRGKVFIDATPEGDLLAVAGVDYALGREDRAKYQERFAGRQPLWPRVVNDGLERWADKHNFPDGVSPYDASGDLLPLIRPTTPVPEGQGDGELMGLQYRVMLTCDPANRRLFDREPDGYDPGRYELARRLMRRLGPVAASYQFVGLRVNVPGQKADANSLGALSLNALHLSTRAYIEASNAERRAMATEIRRYSEDLFYFWTHDPAMGRRRRELAEFGLPADEFTDNGNWPYQLYVREGRRLVGERVLTESDLLRPAAVTDSVLMGSYNIDVREVQRLATTDAAGRPVVRNEGYLSVCLPAPYPVPYGCLVPRREQCQNLLVPVAISASHVAYSSYRMEVQFMMAGQAVGRAAALALRDGVAVQGIDRQELRALLAADGQILTLT
jgi:hypothetical protein